MLCAKNFNLEFLSSFGELQRLLELPQVIKAAREIKTVNQRLGIIRAQELFALLP